MSSLTLESPVTQVLFGAEGKSEDELAKLWPTLGGSAVDFSPSGQDIVDQMIHGLGWRIIGTRMPVPAPPLSFLLNLYDIG